MKKLLSTILCLCMLLSILPTNVFATNITIFNVTVKEPKTGEELSYEASVPETASTYVTKVEWNGELDDSGKVTYGKYEVRVTVRIKDGMDDKYIKVPSKDTVKVNGKSAKLKEVTDDKKQAVVVYTFDIEDTRTEHMHCYCGGYIENKGDHTSHQTVGYKKWTGEKAIQYTDGVARVYLTQDVLLDSTLEIGKGKTLYLCLNGYALVMKTEGQSVVNVRGNATLYLCNCTRGEGGKITSGFIRYGAGIYNSGTVRMYGGIITGNKGEAGAGVWNNAKFYLYGGDIRDNNAINGGGVWNEGSMFEMYEGTISLNVAATGGAIYNNGGTLVLKGGNIEENAVGLAGGGIWNNGGKMELDGSLILANFANYGGGVWNNGDGVIEIKSGSISRNIASTNLDEADGYGGGVWNNEEGIIKMTGGEITFNAAEFGGGVWCNPGSDFLMTGGVVAENQASLGGGVYISAKGSAVANFTTLPPPGKFSLTGRGGILMNIAFVKGGGVYAEGILEQGGDTDIALNLCDADTSSAQIFKADGGQINKYEPVSQFLDVNRDAYYLEPVKWAVEKNITNGTSNATFSPDDTCNTAQILTFLWRAAGSPTVTNPFPYADVYESDYFYMAAQWAKKKGMVEHYALYPNFSCSRMMAVYYIWCAAGKPACKTQLKFTDTKDEQYEKYYEAIAWAVDNGITNGTSDTTFSPGKSCTRAQIVTFLWRAAQKGLI